MSAIDSLLRKNRKYAAGFDEASLSPIPVKQLAVVACMDARIETGRLLGLEEGQAHVIRNAGGIVTDDVVRSLLLSQRLLETREIMLIQHTGCGMLGLEDDELAEQVEKETGNRPPFEIGGFDDVEDSVRDSIARLKASPFIQDKAIRGFVYEVETGRLREVE